MENPNTRPYTAEELEALLNEEVTNRNMPENNKRVKTDPSHIISKDNNHVPTEIVPVITQSPSVEPTAEKPQSTLKMKTYGPLIILGVILTGVGIYLYYDYRKRKEAEKVQKRKSYDKN